jgi:hypothetical protein
MALRGAWHGAAQRGRGGPTRILQGEAHDFFAEARRTRRGGCRARGRGRCPVFFGLPRGTFGCGPGPGNALGGAAALLRGGKARFHTENTKLAAESHFGSPGTEQHRGVVGGPTGIWQVEAEGFNAEFAEARRTRRGGCRGRGRGGMSRFFGLPRGTFGCGPGPGNALGGLRRCCGAGKPGFHRGHKARGRMALPSAWHGAARRGRGPARTQKATSCHDVVGPNGLSASSAPPRPPRQNHELLPLKSSWDRRRRLCAAPCRALRSAPPPRALCPLCEIWRPGPSTTHFRRCRPKACGPSASRVASTSVQLRAMAAECGPAASSAPSV